MLYSRLWKTATLISFPQVRDFLILYDIKDEIESENVLQKRQQENSVRVVLEGVFITRNRLIKKFAQKYQAFWYGAPFVKTLNIYKCPIFWYPLEG